MPTFTRLCVDLNASGNVAGTSWERHTDAGRLSYGTGPAVEPFADPYDALSVLLAWAQAEFGIQATLFAPNLARLGHTGP